MAYQYKVTYRVDGRRTEEVVTADSTRDAEALIKARYANCDVRFVNTTIRV